MPRYQQIARQLKNAIEHGELKAGARLPSSRTWSQELGVSRSTVEKAGWSGAGRPVRLSAGMYVQKKRSLRLPFSPEKARRPIHFKWDYLRWIFSRVRFGRG